MLGSGDDLLRNTNRMLGSGGDLLRNTNNALIVEEIY